MSGNISDPKTTSPQCLLMSSIQIHLDGGSEGKGALGCAVMKEYLWWHFILERYDLQNSGVIVQIVQAH